LLGKLETYYSRRYYKSIEDFPIWNWWKVHETKDLKYLLKENKRLTKHSADIFDKIYSEFIRTFGISDNYKEYMDKIIEIDIAENEMILGGDSSMETFIDIMKEELKDLNASSSNGTYIDTAIAVEKNMGFKLNAKELSVFEYYSYIESLKKSTNNGK
jgi:hypothetical protein